MIRHAVIVADGESDLDKLRIAQGKAGILQASAET